MRILTSWFALIASAAFAVLTLAAQEMPKVLDSRMQLELFAAEPDIVTPTGCTVDHLGRLLVIESHTHQRPDDYVGPESDRIRIVEDTNGDGKADRFRTFFEGTRHTMSIRRGPENWIYVATRAKVFRIRDTDGDDVADEEQTLVYLETKGNYPHNGLSGLALDSDDQLYFGMGENLGATYRMIGADGFSAQGSGEGGVFRCTSDGKKLTRVATGFWNPFGICIDPVGRIFAVGNDADGRPPSRMVQIVETGDYGFQYRYGRSGIHPLQAWDGELPGTLPMVTGTGEAPCEIVVHNGRLVTGSWGDFRVERYELVPVGATFQAKREIVVQGDENFRPVAFAEANDGSLYFTDWVDKSYPVHGKGRIWRLSWKDSPPDQLVPPLSEIEKRAIAASQSADWEALGSDDRFLRQHAVRGIVQSDNSKNDVSKLTLTRFENANQRLAMLQAIRWLKQYATEQPVERIREGLADADPDVRLFAVRWVADLELKPLVEDVRWQLESCDNTTQKLFKASLAAIEYLETGTTTFDPKNSLKYLAKVLMDETQPSAMRVMALRMIPPDEMCRAESGDVERALPRDLISKLAQSSNEALQREAVRTMVLSQFVPAKALNLISGSDLFSNEARADAEFGTMLRKKVATVLDERDRVPFGQDDALFSKVESGGDANRGWRVFHGSGKLTCASCHQVQGRGAKTGPDLTGIAARTSRRDVFDSILHPNQNIAPQFVPTIMVTTDGKTLTGLWQGHDAEGKMEMFQDAEGRRFSVDPNEIEQRRMSETSIMPDDLHEGLTVQQLRDLLVFLESE